MPKTTKPKNGPLEMTKPEKPDPEVHMYGKGVICDTERKGHETPKGRTPLEIVLDASEGFIPLWAKDTTLRWRFRERSLDVFVNPTAAKHYIRELLGNAILAWGDAAPVRFAERDDAWDFEIVMRGSDDCRGGGCVLASAFFPDGGRHELTLYPILFGQTEKEQLETMIHEIGHVFGLRHFFANISENQWPSEIFGTHERFSIMNYGSDSVLTDADKFDLKHLYQLAWGGGLTDVNGTPIRFVEPFHVVGVPADEAVSLREIITPLYRPDFALAARR